jgi:hypothetical protein
VSSTATDIATVPATVTVAGNGTFSIPVKAVAASGSTTISVTAPGYPPLAFSVTVTAAAPGTLTLTTTGVLNTLKGLPMLDESVEFTATVKSKSGTAMQGADVTVQAPSGTRFSSGAASMTGKTNSSGQYTVTLYRASASTPASTVTVAATSAGLTAGKDLIIVGPEVTVGWDQPQITECHYWDWKTAEGDWAQVWQKIPAAHTTGTTDSWVVAAGGVNAVATPGTWSKSEPNKALAWLTLANGGGGVELKKPVPAKKWQFTVRNYSGGPIALRALKLRYVGTAWTTDSTYSANI